MLWSPVSLLIAGFGIHCFCLVRVLSTFPAANSGCSLQVAASCLRDQGLSYIHSPMHLHSSYLLPVLFTISPVLCQWQLLNLNTCIDIQFCASTFWHIDLLFAGLFLYVTALYTVQLHNRQIMPAKPFAVPLGFTTLIVVAQLWWMFIKGFRQQTTLPCWSKPHV